MLENGMVVGAAREWDAICDAGNADADTALDCLNYAIDALGTEAGFAAAVNAAQADGNFDGETVARALFGATTADIWTALRRLADDLIEGAIDCEYYADGGPKGRYEDIARKAVSFSLTRAQHEAVAEKIASRMAKAGVLA